MKTLNHTIVLLSLASVLGCRAQNTSQDSNIQDVIASEKVSSTPKAGKAYLYAARIDGLSHYLYQYECGTLPVLAGKSENAKKDTVIEKSDFCQRGFFHAELKKYQVEDPKLKIVDYYNFEQMLENLVISDTRDISNKIFKLRNELTYIPKAERKNLVEAQYIELAASNDRKRARKEAEISAAERELAAAVKKQGPTDIERTLIFVSAEDQPATNFHSYSVKGAEVAIQNTLSYFTEAFRRTKLNEDAEELRQGK